MSHAIHNYYYYFFNTLPTPLLLKEISSVILTQATPSQWKLHLNLISILSNVVQCISASWSNLSTLRHDGIFKQHSRATVHVISLWRIFTNGNYNYTILMVGEEGGAVIFSANGGAHKLLTVPLSPSYSHALPVIFLFVCLGRASCQRFHEDTRISSLNKRTSCTELLCCFVWTAQLGEKKYKLQVHLMAPGCCQERE